MTLRDLELEELGKKMVELDLIYQIAHVFLTVPDNEMYASVLHIILNALKSRYGVFGYIDENGALVCPSMTREIWSACQIPDKDIIFPRENWGGIWGNALTEKKSLLLNIPFDVPEGHIPIVRALDVPIVFKGAAIGNLLVGNKTSDYTDDDRRLLETIAGQIAPILDARLKREREEKARKLVETSLKKQTHDLKERVKELNCLFGIAKIVEERAISLEEILQGIVELIPPAWQFSEITCARIVLADQEFQTKNFAESTCMQTAIIMIDGRQIGKLLVCYLENKHQGDEGPFSKEERFLMDAIAERIGHIIYRKQLENERNKLHEDLQNALTKILSGYLSVCSYCKKIQDQDGVWHSLETYVRDHSDAQFTHGICPECSNRLFRDFFPDAE